MVKTASITPATRTPHTRRATLSTSIYAKLLHSIHARTNEKDFKVLDMGELAKESGLSATYTVYALQFLLSRNLLVRSKNKTEKIVNGRRRSGPYAYRRTWSTPIEAAMLKKGTELIREKYFARHFAKQKSSAIAFELQAAPVSQKDAEKAYLLGKTNELPKSEPTGRFGVLLPDGSIETADTLEDAQTLAETILESNPATGTVQLIKVLGQVSLKPTVNLY